MPVLYPGQYSDKIGDYSLYYNPLGYGGITVVDGETKCLLSLCDGTRNIAQLAKDSCRPLEDVLSEVQALATREVLGISEHFTKELHNSLKKPSKLSCWFHLTNSCNLACSYCYIHKSSGSMTPETGEMAIEKIVESCLGHKISSLNIKFSGGEPLLKLGLLKHLVEYSQQIKGALNVSYTILSNGALLTNEIAEYLKANKIGIGVSLDGCEKVNDLCRYDKTGGGSYRDVIRGLEILKNHGISPTIMTTVSSQNHLQLLEHTKFLLEGGYRFRFSLERDCDSGFPELLNREDSLIESLHECYDYIESNLPDDDITKIHTFGDVSFKGPLKRSCSAGSNFLAVGFDGKLGVCGLGLASPFGQIDSVTDLINDLRVLNSDLSTSVASEYGECRNCVWRKSCAGACPLQTKASFGSFNHASPYCRVYKQILPRILRIKGMQMIRGLQG